MENYTLMATEWDYAYPEEIKDYQKQGVFTPTMDKEILNHCGSLYPFITNETNAIKYSKEIKKQFPFVHFELYKGKTWGTLELVKEF